MLDVAFVGAGSREASGVWNKSTAKSIVEAAGIVTPEWISLPKNTFKQLNAKSVLGVVNKKIGFPLITKPVEGGSAQAGAKVRHPEWPALVRQIDQLDPTWKD